VTPSRTREAVQSARRPMAEPLTPRDLIDAPPRSRAHMEYGPAYLKGGDGWWRRAGEPYSLNSAAVVRAGVRRLVLAEENADA
jgi:hypothetical protein